MKIALIWLIVAVVFLGLLGFWMSDMPGQSVQSAVPLNDEQRTTADNLSMHVATLAGEVGTRSLQKPQALADAGDYIAGQLERAGLKVNSIAGRVGGQDVRTFEVTLTGTSRPQDVVLLGAHYDSAPGSPGADDNASGCGVLIEIARAMAEKHCERTIRFVWFANSAGEMAGAESSGGAEYARDARKRGDKIVAMLSIDSVGIYRETRGGKPVDFPLALAYPDAGNFVLFAGDMGARDLVRTCVGEFRKSGRMASEGVAAPGFLSGVMASDDVGFRKQGFPAVLVTDTGKRRSDAVGTPTDRPDKLDYQRMARLTSGLVQLVQVLGQRSTML